VYFGKCKGELKNLLIYYKIKSINLLSDESIPSVSRERENFYHEYFMAMAILAARPSKDPVTKVGAVIVNDEKKIVGIGYNRMPIGCDAFTWEKNKHDPLEDKRTYVVHAEVNAIIDKNSADVKNCTMYVTLFPCNECAKIIIQSRIGKVIYIHDRAKKTISSKRMLDEAGIKYSKYITQNKQLKIDFEKVNTEVSDDLGPPSPKLQKLDV
jgi:dCMP deaminase